MSIVASTAAPSPRLPHLPRGRAAVRGVSLAFATLTLLSACSKPVEKDEDIRPVRAVTVHAASAVAALELSGEVRARIESRLGFRVAGKIIHRQVELGSLVRRGQVLMQLDPQDLALAQTQAKAALAAADSNRELARAELHRYQELRSKNFVAAAVLDAKQVAWQSAQSAYEQALAAHSSQSNQTGYASLVADADGVVTSIDAEVGQVVAAGTPVIRVAQKGEMEVVVGVPENKINGIAKMNDIRVSLWAEPGKTVAGRLRELSPIADPVTRTYSAKVVLPTEAANVRLGMTATVRFALVTPDQVMHVPMTALLQEKGSDAVWVVRDGIVKLTPVRVLGAQGEEALVAGGLADGQTVVTAGVHFLKPEQRVTLLGAPAAAAPAGAAR
ncbi:MULTISPECIES: efflux RND transporter periplasmic adaptor subunit [unclassified Undibacterium]|uniref:efflux RND transporter periplasmic adaptor subunit n=1 Tax=unclassified Undibacterium TaxID=2630295 RepID=UPI002AC95027|nr:MULTISPECIES: efflux RND transporter periplasmic adaptor subunit [unclassified Undibacterium]MEB0138050.1 efflux RND transporter periplasmic adaptor subunit [Undibacterium sp. CCC2.1]MEB0171212.1 efflux RND transporter periplasmic adaptor subunit [Undibacterium sp. CCC1.1]MEB0175257.1 efflux RND transporter periplasmic adaptor subunit [Undibacterium sp. CCC3.4]MEB0214665.1 efflux RND transporter periplasmic adaptor subunit [Undibacterium sp. 5I2]WPX42432.1 efflux RND transporter periplasmic